MIRTGLPILWNWKTQQESQGWHDVNLLNLLLGHCRTLLLLKQWAHENKRSEHLSRWCPTMTPCITHSMIATEQQKWRPLPVLVPSQDGLVYLLYDLVHFKEFGSHQRAGGPRCVADVIQTKEMQDQYIPVLLFQLTVNVPGYIVVNLGKRWPIKAI